MGHAHYAVRRIRQRDSAGGGAAQANAGVHLPCAARLPRWLANLADMRNGVADANARVATSRMSIWEGYNDAQQGYRP